MAKMRITRQDCETVIHRSLPQHTVSYVIHVALMASKTENETTRQAHEKKINALLESRGTSTTSSDGPLPDPEATPRISIIGEATLNADATRILAMGPKFIPSLQLNRKTADELRISLAHVAYQLRWKGHFSNSRYTTAGTPAEQDTLPIPAMCPFEHRRLPPPTTTDNVERKLQALVVAVDKLIQKEQLRPSHEHNLSPADRRLLNVMKEDDNHYTPSDKGGEMVVMNSARYNALAWDHLSDDTTYEKTARDPTDTQEREINALWKTATKKTTLPALMVNKLVTRHSRIAQFYHLPKTHKRQLNIRPIVSCINSPGEKMAWLLHQIFRPFLSEVPAHLENTHQLLTKLKAIPAEQLAGKTPISLDVVSLYTNVNVQEAMEVINRLLRNKFQEAIWGIPIDSIMEILSYLLRNNSFHFDGAFFNQVRGLAMGSKISPTLAILVMDHFERSTLFQRTLSHPISYLRYIDDCVVIIDRDTNPETFLPHLNSLHPSIRFELQTLQGDGFLPVLDTAIRITHTGQLLHKFFVKEANRGIFIHAKSALPDCIKRNAVKEEMRRATNLCSDSSSSQVAQDHMYKKFRANGYSREKIRKYTRPRRHNQQQQCNDPSNDYSCIFKVPFISDKFNGQLKRLIKKSDLNIQVVTRPAPSLVRQLNKNKRFQVCNKRSCPIKDPTMCNATNVVYSATCSLCGDFYIGSTSPPLHNRIAQHFQPSRKTAIHVHATSRHQCQAKEIFTFKIVSRHPSEIRCRIAEALTIKNLSPPLNTREEFIDYRRFLI